jgi:hypothetical protein
MHGSIGNVTYQQNRYSAIVARQRPSLDPKYVPSDLQIVYQDLMRAAVLRWQLLTTDQRLRWRFYAAQSPHRNSLGDSITLTGQAFYIGVRIAASTFDPSLPDDAWDNSPDISGYLPAPFIQDLSLIGSGQVDLQITSNYLDAPIGMVLWYSIDHNPSINFWTGPYELIDNTSITSLIANTPTVVSIPTPNTDRRVFWRSRFIDASNYCRISHYVFGSSDI